MHVGRRPGLRRRILTAALSHALSAPNGTDLFAPAGRGSLPFQVAAKGTAQTPEATQQAGTAERRPGYTLGVRSRLVIGDVSVTDREGRPVTCLP